MSALVDVLMLCPFCGGAPEMQKTQFGQPVMRWINCPQCEASATAYEKQEDAVSAWNHRTYGGAVAELIAFVENIAEPCSEPLNSAVGYRDKDSRRKFMGILRSSARALLARVGGAK